MPVNIDVFDFKCFNQLRNGENFNSNLSEFTPNLVGNIGEKVKVQFTAVVSQTSFASDTDSWQLFNTTTLSPDPGELHRSSGSFIDDDMQVGDQFVYFADWVNRKTTSPEFQGLVSFIASDGSYIKYTLVSGVEPSSGEKSNVGLVFDQSLAVNRNKAVFVRFGLIENDENFNYQSKTTEAQQVYYVGGLLLSVPKTAISLGTIKDWVSGSMTVEQLNVTGFYDATYVFEHEFILNPFFILSYRQFIDSGTIPELLAGDSSLKYAVQLEFRKTLTNTGSNKIRTFENLPGFVGWYGENFNGLNPQYEVLSVAFEDDATGDPLNGININQTTKITVVVDNPDAAITDYSCAFYLVRLPTSESEYIGTVTDLPENFILLTDVVSDPATSSGNLSTSLVGGNLVMEITVSYTTAQKLLLTTDDEFLLLVQVEDPTISVGDSDRLMMIAELGSYVDVDFLQDFIQVNEYGFLSHGQELGIDIPSTNLGVSNEDGILLSAVFGQDVTKDVIITDAAVKLVAYNSTDNKSFELDSFNFNIGDPVINVAGNQLIEVNSNRGYPLPSGDQFNLARIQDVALVGDFFRHSMEVGQKIKWQEWIKNRAVDVVFFDENEPNNNQNFKSSNYSAKEGYVIKVALVLEVTGVDDLGRAVSGTFTHYGGDITVLDYDESDDGVSGEIKTFDNETGVSLDGGVLYNGKDTLFRTVFSDAGAMSFGIHRIEPINNPGDGILELSSVMPSIPNNLLKPISGETLLKFSLVGSVLTTECLIDGSLIQEGVSYKLSARAIAGPPAAPQNLIVIGGGVGALTFSWDAPASAVDSYILQTSPESDFSSGVIEVTGIGGGLTSYEATGLPDGVTVYGRLKSVKGGLESVDWSNTASGLTWLDFGLALDFDGVNDRVTVTFFETPIDYDNGVFISFWVNFKNVDQSSGNNELFWLFGNTSNDYIRGHVSGADASSSSKVAFRIQFRKNGGSLNAPNVGEIDLDAHWHNVIFYVFKSTIDPTKGVRKAYIDGVEVYTDPEAGDKTFNDFPVNFFNASNSGLADSAVRSQTHEMIIDDFIVINGIDISQSDVDKHYNNGHGSKHLYDHVNTFLHWKLNKSGAIGGGDNTALNNVIEDSSANGYDGTLTNFAKTGASSNWVNNNIND